MSSIAKSNPTMPIVIQGLEISHCPSRPAGWGAPSPPSARNQSPEKQVFRFVHSWYSFGHSRMQKGHAR